MLPLTGYCDSWSVPQGASLNFRISSAANAPYRTRVARVFHADPNPAGLGYVEEAIASNIDGEHEGLEQPIYRGSWAEVPHMTLPADQTGIIVSMTFFPTLPRNGAQVLMEWTGRNGSVLSLAIEDGGPIARLSCKSGDVSIALGQRLRSHRWYDAVLTVDIAGGTIGLTCTMRPKLGEDAFVGRATACSELVSVLSGDGCMSLACARIDGVPGRHFEGKLESPRLETAEGSVIAAWDFAHEIGGDRIHDTGTSDFHGRLHNLPTRAVTGAAWTGRIHCWSQAPEQYAAIHFHSDDMGDAGWDRSLALEVGGEWPSGLYALHLENDAGRDIIPFVVRPAAAARKARVALVLPTLTYQIYAQYPKGYDRGELGDRLREWGGLGHIADDHVEYGLSAYNTHRDGSGVNFVSMRRPMVDKRVNQVHRSGVPEGSSGADWLVCDGYIIAWLRHAGVDVDILTDHDLHAEGAALLQGYRAVLTGYHPEYHTQETLDAFAGYIECGGRLMYLGGNGFYWKVASHPDGPWAIELRRAESGIRTWADEPGQSHFAFDGTLGGLWRRLGRAPQGLVGVGFSAQGGYAGYPYTLSSGALDARIDFLWEGLEGLSPGDLLGTHSFSGGGAAGHEIDRADLALGTPPHALVLASAVIDDPSFWPVNEERLINTWPAPRDEIIRSDIVFYETPMGGAVFSVGSMSFAGALPIDGFNSPLARMTLNVLRRLLSETPFLMPTPLLEHGIEP